MGGGVSPGQASNGLSQKGLCAGATVEGILKDTDTETGTDFFFPLRGRRGFRTGRRKGCGEDFSLPRTTQVVTGQLSLQNKGKAGPPATPQSRRLLAWLFAWRLLVCLPDAGGVPTSKQEKISFLPK